MGEKNFTDEIKCLLQCQTVISSNTNGYNILAHAQKIIFNDWINNMFKNTEIEKKKHEGY